MHELSLVMGVLNIAEEEMKKHQAALIEEIELDIGLLSGVEMAAFDFAWEQAKKSTPLENTKRTINLIAGEGVCQDCNHAFSVQEFYDPCPNCGQHLIHILKGKEFRVKSLTVS